MPFDEIQFPVTISRGATSNPLRLTDIVTLRSGHEQRNTIWADSRRSYQAGLGIRQLNDLYDVIDFWEGRRGALRGFRFKDWADYKSGKPNDVLSSMDTTMLLVTTTTFQLQKEYSSSLNPYIRTISKPVDNGTIVIRDDTGSLTETTDYSVDFTTGIVTFNIIPTGIPTAGFEFDVPVRFKDQSIQISVELFNVGTIPDIDILELRI